MAAPTIHEQLAVLAEELALARSISGGGHEPAYHYLADPPGLPVIQAYLQEWEAQLSPGQILPLFRVELPPLAPDGPPLVEVLSRPLGLPMRGKWKDSFFAKERLGGALRTRQIELTILTVPRPNS
jgi:hypothetical protein